MQQAVFVTEVGKPLTLGTRAIPDPKKGQVQIKVVSTMRMLPPTIAQSMSSDPH